MPIVYLENVTRLSFSFAFRFDDLDRERQC
jgi:hypothetical protein